MKPGHSWPCCAVGSDPPAVVAVFTIRSDNYERLQTADELESVHQEIVNLPPMPRGSYAEVIKGPTRRLDGTERALRIDDALVEELLTDIDKGEDALPLLAFTLERVYDEYHATGQLPTRNGCQGQGAARYHCGDPRRAGLRSPSGQCG